MLTRYEAFRDVGAALATRGMAAADEELDFDGATPIVRPGRGAPVCVARHAAGRDYYLLGFQP
jgi:hypothetical protein